MVVFSGCVSLEDLECRNVIVLEGVSYCEISFVEALVRPVRHGKIAVIGYANFMELPNVLGLRKASIEGPAISSELISVSGTALQNLPRSGYYRVFGQLLGGQGRSLAMTVDSLEYWKPDL